MRALWFGLGIISLGLGMLGAVLPLLPTVPFLLLASFGFARSSPRFHDWLVSHPTYGPHILAWTQSGAIRPQAKKLATLTIGLTFGLSFLLGASAKILALQALVLSLVLLFIWTRPPH